MSIRQKTESKSTQSIGLDHSDDEIELSSLMNASLNGDADSYRRLLQKVKLFMVPFVANSLSKFGLSSAGGQDDVVQEILLGIHLKRATFDVDQFFLPWMYAIARYKTIDYLRRNKVRFQSVSIDDVFDEIEANQLPEFDSELDLESLCEKLSIKQRDLLLLVKVEGLSITEAADKTGYSVSDVKVTVHRAIKELKKQLKENGHEN